MVIRIKAKHFKNSSFKTTVDCPLVRATKEALQSYGYQDIKVAEGITAMVIACEGVPARIYEHRPYQHRNYRWDKFKALLLSFSNLTVRKVTIEGFPPQHLSTKTPLEVIEELEGKRELWVRH